MDTTRLQENNILMSMHRAFLGEIDHTMRGITFLLKDQGLTILVIFDREPSEEQLEDLDAVLTEMISDFPDFTFKLETKVKLSSVEPTKDNLSRWFYLRKGF